MSKIVKIKLQLVDTAAVFDTDLSKEEWDSLELQSQKDIIDEAIESLIQVEIITE